MIIERLQNGIVTRSLNGRHKESLKLNSQRSKEEIVTNVRSTIVKQIVESGRSTDHHGRFLITIVQRS